VKIVMRPDVAPKHVERIRTLVRQGFYDGTIFHRVIEGFMAQGGDPTGTGQGGSKLPDLEPEFTDLPHVRGAVSMARAQAADPRLREVVYDPKAVVTVPVKRGVVALVVLDADEAITEVAAGLGGDCGKAESAWCITAQPGGRTLFVKNLAVATTEEGLRDMFAQAGPGRAVRIPKRLNPKYRPSDWASGTAAAATGAGAGAGAGATAAAGPGPPSSSMSGISSPAAASAPTPTARASPPCSAACRCLSPIPRVTTSGRTAIA
jgi:hypothetical protein